MRKLETKRLILRKFNREDADKCYRNFGQDKEIGRYLPMFPMPDQEAMCQMIDGFISKYESDGFIWVIERNEDREPIGYLSVDIPYRELGIAEISYLLGEKYQGHGYAIEAVKKYLNICLQRKICI